MPLVVRIEQGAGSLMKNVTKKLSTHQFFTRRCLTKRNKKRLQKPVCPIKNSRFKAYLSSSILFLWELFYIL